MSEEKQGTGVPQEEEPKVIQMEVRPVGEAESRTQPSSEEEPKKPPKEGYPLFPPDCSILNGTGFVIVQMHRKDHFVSPGGIEVVPGFEAEQRYRSPIPSDAIFFVVEFDRDMNLHYRKEKLKLLGLNEKDAKHKPIIKKLEKSGDLDILELVDEVIINHENFIPVRMKLDPRWDYFRVHTMDILAVKKHPRTYQDEE